MIEKVGAEALKLMKKLISFNLLVVLSAVGWVFLRYVNDFVDDLHDVLRVVTRRVVFDGDVVFVDEIVLIILPI